MQRRLMLTVVLALLCPTPKVWAQIADELPTDARSIAMGEAGTATAVGPAAVWWNPGALALSDGIGLSIGGRRLVPQFFTDVWVGNSAVSFGAKGVGVGAHFTYLSYGESEVNVSPGKIEVSQPFEYTLRLGVAIDVLRFTPQINRNLKLGIGGTLNITHVDSPAGLSDGWIDAPQHVATVKHLDLAALAQVRFPVEVVSGGGYLGGRLGIRWDNVANQDIVLDDQGTGISRGRSVHVGVALEGEIQKTQRWQLYGVVAFDAQVFVGEMSDRKSIYKVGFEFRPGLQGKSHTVFVAARAGYIKDENNGVSGASVGGAMGVTFHAATRDHTLALELATQPKAQGMDRANHLTLAGSIGL